MFLKSSPEKILAAIRQKIGQIKESAGTICFIGGESKVRNPDYPGPPVLPTVYPESYWDLPIDDTNLDANQGVSFEHESQDSFAYTLCERGTRRFQATVTLVQDDSSSAWMYYCSLFVRFGTAHQENVHTFVCLENFAIYAIPGQQVVVAQYSPEDEGYSTRIPIRCTRDFGANLEACNLFLENLVLQFSVM